MANVTRLLSAVSLIVLLSKRHKTIQVSNIMIIFFLDIKSPLSLSLIEVTDHSLLFSIT
jgi:hypothetical protein